THLQGLSQDYLKKHDELKTRLEETERHYQEQILKAQEEAHQMMAQALKDAESARQQAIEQAHVEAERIMAQATKTRETLQQEMIQSMELKAVEQAGELVKTVLPQILRQAAHEDWLTQLISDGLVDGQKLDTRETCRDATVVSAFPLTDAQRTLLQERLEQVMGGPITMKETVEPALIAGLTITIGHMVLDGSLSNKLREATRHAQNRIE
ncbi:MAG: F0F1 ATP synthase subunit delta, partial [Chloroflexota bacterium]